MVKIGRWLVDGDVGASSMALCSFYLTAGNDGECASYLPTPSDPSDFDRCVQFLEECVDKSRHTGLIMEIGSVTKNWKKIRDNWFTLMALYREEKDQIRSPKLYALMKKIGL